MQTSAHADPRRGAALLRLFRRFSAALVGLFVAFAVWQPASADGPPSEPFLVIEPGMHTGAVKRIDVDMRERFIVTGSYDKTIRVWSARDGRLLNIIRPPIDTGNEGKIYAVTISPEGDLIAAAGWTGWRWYSKASIYIFDRSSGQMVRRIKDLPQVVNDLEFSPDGRYLAGTLARGRGLRIWDTGTWRQVASDEDFDDTSYAISWSADGQLAAISYDKSLRLYDRNLRRIVKRQTNPQHRIEGTAFSPDGRRVAVSYSGVKLVEVYSVPDLRLIETPDVSGGDDDQMQAVTWSADGSYLFAAGLWDADNGLNSIRRWPIGGGGSPLDMAASNNTVQDLDAFGYWGVVYASSGPGWGAFDGQGRQTIEIGPATPDLRNQREVIAVNQDATRVFFGLEQYGKRPHIFDLTQRTLTPAREKDGDMTIPRIESRGLDVSGWNGTRSPRLNGREIELSRYETSRSLSITPDGSRFVLGADWSLRGFDRNGRELWKHQVPGLPWSVNIAGNGKVFISGMGDGTVRWYRVSDGKELLALFVHRDGDRWIAWTPSGYYTASPGGEDLIGWHVNNGPDRAADFFGAGQFRDRFYRPDVVERVLDVLDEEEALRLADNANRYKQPRRHDDSILGSLPPVISITSPAEGSGFSDRQVTVRYTVRSPSGQEVKNIRVLVNGRLLTESSRGLKRVGQSTTEQSLTVTLPEEDVELALLAETANATSEPALVRLRWEGRRDQFVARPKLYALVVGVSAYQQADLRLGYAAKDATDFAAMLKTQEGQLYREAEVRVLTDQDATQREVLKGLEWLRRSTTNRDVGMLFLAGHGVTDADGQYYYLPQDADPDFLLATAITNAHIRQILSTLPGKAVFFTDTCHAGNVVGGRARGAVDINRVANELASAENGVVVFTSSTGRQISIEDRRWENGAFTEALLEGFAGKADYTRDGTVSINELDLWLAERVKSLTEGQQSPTTTKPETVPDFPVFVAR